MEEGTRNILAIGESGLAIENEIAAARVDEAEDALEDAMVGFEELDRGVRVIGADEPVLRVAMAAAPGGMNDGGLIFGVPVEDNELFGMLDGQGANEDCVQEA